MNLLDRILLAYYPLNLVSRALLYADIKLNFYGDMHEQKTWSIHLKLEEQRNQVKK
jgi:hypothetical protein